MIKFNNSDIIDWNFDDSNIIKVYHNGAIVFYKFDSEQGGYKVCYAVVDDITQYSDREFDDVFDKATEKWYKLNNLNQYEEYGVYGSGRNVTTYNGKLTIDGTQEYEWNGSNWVNLGEVSGSSRVPVGYTEVEYVETDKTQYIDTGIYLNTSNFEVGYTIVGNSSCWGYCHQNVGNGTWLGVESTTAWYGRWSSNTTYKVDMSSYLSSENNTIVYKQNGVTINGSTVSKSLTMGSDSIANKSLLFFGRYDFYKGGVEWQNNFKAKSLYIKNNGELVRDFVPAKRDSDNKYGMYDLVTNTFYTSPNGNSFSGGAETGGTEYPKYYSEKSEPLDNLTFNTLAEAQAYAEANCVYDGMHATIGGVKYYFDSTDENGWAKVLEYYKFEDVTPNQASGWTISGSDTYNPDSSYYDDFDLQTTSTSSSYKIAKVTIYGYDHFTYYMRTSGFSNYCYVVATNVDEVSTPPSTMSYNSSSAITNTYNWNKSPKSAVNLSNYRRVTYNSLDKTVEHTFYVYFYGRTYSSYIGNATILIPKEQTNENWEQVAFSASSNVASSSKNLYIDGNNSTSGGTDRFYYRWIVGLPSGSHSSYTNYSNYNYCPNATSSTFTSVAGEQRQVNFTYDNTSNKTLSFRLTDGSNVLTPSNTVYYNMTYYNSCGASSSSSNVTFPRSQSVKVGGRFRFANSSNRHYIYGYSPNISLNTDYYADNYQSTFDITYTKLSEEAVTVTYTTYDPSDTEVPAFKTDITWPYNGGTTSSTTLTSYDVPYTYPYVVAQTSGKFSAASQPYTAGQSSRTITFTLYPNNREFATVADMEAYAYAWEGMRAIVGDTNYEYKNGEWVEYAVTIWLDPNNTGSLNPNYQIGHYWGEGYKMIYTLYIDGSYSSDTGSFWRWNQQTPIEFNFYSNGFYYDFHNPTSTTSPSVYTGDNSWRIMKNGTLRNYESGQILNIILSNGAVRVELAETGAAIVTGSTSVTAQNWYSGLYQAAIGWWVNGNKVHIKEIQVYDANDVLVNDLIFVKNPNVTGSQEISVYDSVLDVKYDNTNSNTPLYHIET